MLSVEQFLQLVGKGEDSQVEFKVGLPSNVRELAEEVCGLANADGGFVFIGVDDDNQIVGASIDNAKRSAVIDSLGEITPQLPFEFYPLAVGGNEVWVVEVPRGNNLPYIYSGSVFVRQGATCRKLRSRDEMMNFFRECNSLHFDSAPVSNFDLMAELDKENFCVFCRKARISDDVEPLQVLRNLNVFDTRSGCPKAGAVMFFAEHPEHRFPQSWVHCVRFKGKENVMILDDKRYFGPIYQQYVQSLNWLIDKLELRIVVDDAGPHKEILELPEDALREALVNALSHRDYYEAGAVVVISVYDDRVVISNPGGLLSEVADDFGHRSLSRNPFVFDMFTRMHLVEQVGSGIPRMCRLMNDMGLPDPAFNTKGMFSITFSRMESENDGVESKNDGVELKNEGVEMENVGMKSENEGVELKNDGVELKNEGVEIESVGMKSENEGVEMENVGMKYENEGVELKNEGVEIENVGMKSENEGVEMKNDGVEIKIKLNKTQSNLLEILSRNGVFSAKDLTEMLSVSLSTVERNLSFLQKNGFIKREGSDRYGKWIVLKKK